MKNKNQKNEQEKASKFNKKQVICNILMLVFLVFFLVLDIALKYVIESKLGSGGVANFIPGFINLVVVHNYGAAWGLFAKVQWLLIVVTFIFLIVFLWFFFTKKSNSYLLGIASGLLLSGTLGNLYDRLVFGYVRDFLNFEFMNFPVFNIADSALTVGIILLLIYFVFIYPKELKIEKQRMKKEFGKNGEINTDDLDNIDTKRFDLKEALNFKKMWKKHSEKKAEKKRQTTLQNVEADNDKLDGEEDEK